MTGIPPINPMMPGLGIVPPPIPPDMPAVKEIIHCKSCTLFPPNPRECLLVPCLCLYLCPYKPQVCVRKGPFLALTAAKSVPEQQEQPVLVMSVCLFQKLSFQLLD